MADMQWKWINSIDDLPTTNGTFWVKRIDRKDGELVTKLRTFNISSGTCAETWLKHWQAWKPKEN